MAQPAETGIELPPPEFAPPPAPSAKIQYLRAITVDGRTFDLKKRWPTVHEHIRIDTGLRVDSFRWRYNAGTGDTVWEFLGKPKPDTAFAKAGKVISCEVAIHLALVEGLIAPAEHQRVLEQRKKDEIELLTQNGVLAEVPGHSRIFRELISSDRRTFMPGRPGPVLGDPKKEMIFRGTVRGISQILHDQRGLYYEIWGEPAPGTLPHEKGRLLLCELPRHLVESVEATWLATDFAKLTEMQQLAEDVGPQGPETEAYDEDTNPLDIID